MYGIIQRHVWIEISRLETDTINYVLDELIFVATTSGIGTRSCEVVADTLVSLASIHVRGKLLARLRKASANFSYRPGYLTSALIGLQQGISSQLQAAQRRRRVASTRRTDTLDTSSMSPWPVGLTLTCRSCEADCLPSFPYQIQLFVPELVHAMTLIVCHGPIMLRTSLHSMACNMIQALYLARSDDAEAARSLSDLLDEFLMDEVTILFGIRRPGPGEDYEPVRVCAAEHIASVEGLTSLFQRVMVAAAASESECYICAIFSLLIDRVQPSLMSGKRGG